MLRTFLLLIQINMIIIVVLVMQYELVLASR
jgi:hypothetical protein